MRKGAVIGMSTGLMGAVLAACGGAMPYSLSFCRPCSLIQSVVQAGDSTVRTFELRNPSRSSASSISSVIIFIAGHPE